MHRLTVAAPRREVSDLLVMIGWSISEMGLNTVMVQEGKVEALQGTVMCGAMIALKLMDVVAVPAVVLGMMTGAPLMKMMTTTAAHSHLRKYFLINEVRTGSSLYLECTPINSVTIVYENGFMCACYISNSCWSSNMCCLLTLH